MLYRTAEGLRDRGHEVHLFCGRFHIPPPNGTFAHRVPCLNWPRTARLLTFAFLTPRVIDRYSCDVVLSFDRMIRQDLFRSGGGAHRAFVAKMMAQGSPWRRLWYRISPYHLCLLSVERRQMSHRGSRKIIAVYGQGKKEIVEAYGIPEEKVVVIYNGVDTERFHPQKRYLEGRKIREGLGIPLESPVVLFVGTGFRRKGLDRLLDLWSCSELRGVYLVVVGNDARLSRYRRRRGSKEILFVGSQSLVEDYYAAADVFVLPSVQEAFGNAVLEAMAAGLPVVTISEVGAAEGIHGELREGILRDPTDPEDLKSRILRLLDKGRWSTLSRTARELAESYSWDRYLNELERELYEVAGQHL